MFNQKLRFYDRDILTLRRCKSNILYYDSSCEGTVYNTQQILNLTQNTRLFGNLLAWLFIDHNNKYTRNVVRFVLLAAYSIGLYFIPRFAVLKYA
jgi:hypothetical protein